MIQLLKFALVGVLNTCVGYAAIFVCMYAFGLSPVVSNIIGYSLGLTVSYTFNRRFTFQSTGDRRREIFRFVMIFGLAYLVNLGVLVASIRWLRWNEGISQLLAGASYTILFFVLSKTFVFKEQGVSAVAER